jgi:hypothetical protein
MAATSTSVNPDENLPTFTSIPDKWIVPIDSQCAKCSKEFAPIKIELVGAFFSLSF